MSSKTSEQEANATADDVDEQRDRDERAGVAPEAPEADTTNLGPCHYCGEGRPASVMATRDDGTGWIAVCDEHRKDADNDGFTVNDSGD